MTDLETRLQGVLARLVGQVRLGALQDPLGLNTPMNAAVLDAETPLQDLHTPAAAYAPNAPRPTRLTRV